MVALQGLLQHLLTHVVQVQALEFLLGLDVLLGNCVFDSCHGCWVLGDRCWECGGWHMLNLRCNWRCSLHIVELLFQRTHLAAHIVHVTTKLEQNLIQNLTFVLKAMIATAIAMDGGQLCGFMILRDELTEHLSGDGTFGRKHTNLFSDILQLANVARPLIVQQHLLGTLVEHHAVHLIFLGHLQGKQTEQQDDILATLTQRRHLDGYRVEAIVEVFAEATLADGLTDIHIGSGYNTHIGFTNLGATHRDILTSFEHTQQSRLGGQRQFAHLVKEERTLVSYTKVTWRIVDGTSVRTLYMSKEF